MKILHKKGIPEFIIKELKFYSGKIKDLLAYTIMPDHIHLLVEVEYAKDLSRFLCDFKKFTSKKIRKKLKIEYEHIWQRGTMDHCIRDEDDFLNHLAYVFYNCEKHLNILPKNFPYHNFKEFVKQDYFNKDFYMFDDSRLKFKQS
jgi:hypothetical protein